MSEKSPNRRLASYWVEKLGLIPHPEGGYYKETYKSKEEIQQSSLPSRFHGNRNFSTMIYFLLEKFNFSAFHRIAADETWHFYAGDSLTIYTISNSGERKDILLGPDLEKGESFQVVIEAGHWFGAAVNAPGEYTLVGCTVSPGFDFADFELGKKETLINEFPQHTELIERLTH